MTSRDSDVQFSSTKSSSSKLGPLLDISKIRQSEVCIHKEPCSEALVSPAAVHLLCGEGASVCQGYSGARKPVLLWASRSGEDGEVVTAKGSRSPGWWGVGQVPALPGCWLV